ncbi:MAG: septal ring lytic transglycosylase RlpA family protein [Thermodesulfobacteriota bacterium]
MNQADYALRLYSFFLNRELESLSDTSKDLEEEWKEVEVETRKALRLRHRSLCTDILQKISPRPSLPKRGNSSLSKACLPIIMIFSLFFLAACGPKQRIVYKREIPPPEKKEVLKEESKEEKPAPPEKIERRESKGIQYGIASWYGDEFHGRPTSSGEIYDMYQLTCAHNTLPLGSSVMVTNLENGKSLELKVNDRGPFVKDRIIDLSYAAAKILDMWEKGTAYVKVEVIGPLIEQIQRFTLQVGSFADETNAQNLADQLRKSFENVYVTTVETLTQKYHRVRVGQFDTKESALSMAEKLSQMGFKVLVTSR